MIIFSKIFISGVEINDSYNYNVAKSISDNNTSSNFNAQIENFGGRHKSDFTVGNSVKIYADTSNIIPTSGQLVFNGIVENITYEGQGDKLEEKITLEGRDYTARLVDRTVEPETYTNWEIGSIVNDIVTKYTSDIGSAHVNSTTTILPRISFRHTPVYDAIKQLADIAGYTFYVDVNQDLHFEPIGSASSGYTFTAGSNIIDGNFKFDRESMYNQVWVYGDRYLDGYKETFKGGSYSTVYAGSPYTYISGTGSIVTVANGSTYPLIYTPYNTEVTVSGNTIQPGNIQNQSSTAPSGTKYIISQDDKYIIFTSGTNYGNNIPGSNINIVVNYKRSLPIVKVGDNELSKGQYSQRNKIIVDKDIKDPQTAQTILQEQLDALSVPLIEGNLTIKGVVNVMPGNTAIVNMPNQAINNQTYNILEAKYAFTPENNMNGRVLSLKMNERIGDFTDTMKNTLLQLKKLQASEMSDTDVLTRFQYTTGSMGLRTSGIQVWTRSIAGSNLLYDSPIFGLYNTFQYGGAATLSWVLGNPSQSILGTSVLGNKNGVYNLIYSGGYF